MQSYVGNSPLHLGISGAFAQAAFDLLQQSVAGQLKLTFEDGIVDGSAIDGVELTPAAAMLLEIIKDHKIKVSLQTVAGFYYYNTELKENVFFEGDAFRGSFTHNGKLTATNILSPEVSKGYDIASTAPTGTTALHSVFEAYIGGKYFPNTRITPGQADTTAYLISHDWASCIDTNYKDLPRHYIIDKGTVKVNGVLDSNAPKIIDSRTQEIIYTFPTFKYSK